MRATKLPTVSWYHLVSADPRKMRKLVAARRHLSLWFLYSTVAIAAVMYVALGIHDRVVVATKAAAYSAAYDKASADFELTYKERLLDNKDELSRACTSWWFDLSHKDRKLSPRK